MKSTIIAALLGFLLPVIGIMGFNAWTDPFRYYRPIEDSRYSDNARWQNPGMIRNSRYDTALIGTSRFENFKPSMFADAGWKVLKVTAPGSLANEQLDTMEMVLEQGQAKRIIIEMSYVSYIASRQRDPGEFPRFLYRSTPETSFQYLLSFDLLRESFLKAARRQQPLDELYVWYPRYEDQFNERNMLRVAVANCAASPPGRNEPPPTLAYLDRLDRLVADHPDVEIIAVFSPVAAITLGRPAADGRIPGRLMKRLNFRSGIAAIAGKHRNMTLYDYASEAQIVLDYSRYKDPGHYDMTVTEQMAREISSGSAPLADLDDVNGPLLDVHAQVDVTGLPCLSDELAESSLAAG